MTTYYENLVNDAFISVVKKVLGDLDSGKLEPNPALYITFKTNFAGVEISEVLKQKYPSEMTIILQHQYENLLINDDGFSVALSFSGKKEALKIPFCAMASFLDMDNNFSLAFNPIPKKSEKKVAKAEIINLKDLKKK